MAPRICCFYLFFLACGCRSNVGIVSGTVTFKGEMVTSGTVTFISGGKVIESDIQDGAYEIIGIPPGEAKIIVVRLDPKQPDPYQLLNNVRKQMIEKNVANPKEIDPNVVTDPMELASLQMKRHLLPHSYSSPETSDLQFTVAPGPNRFDIVLQEKPKSK